MTMPSFRHVAAAFCSILMAATLGCEASPASRNGAVAAANAAPAANALSFDDAFWKYWGDGRAELAGYDLTFPRYGQERKGVAVTIFVTETFSNESRVKAAPGVHAKSDEFPVMKLNRVEDFPTGVYDYNVMTSAFVALAPVNGRPAGSATKVSFSAQEWCGHVYSQLVFDDARARRTLHSYFDREADQHETLEVPNDALSGDALLLWARGFAAPVVSPGESHEVKLVRSLESARVRHEPVVIESAKLAVAAEPVRITVPAGEFEAELRTVAIAGGETWTFHVERAAPRRVLAWSSSAGYDAKLIASDRLKYWEMNREGGEAALAKLGLKSRALRTP